MACTQAACNASFWYDASNPQTLSFTAAQTELPKTNTSEFYIAYNTMLKNKVDGSEHGTYGNILVNSISAS